MIVEYKQHRNELGQLITPLFVDSGGYYGKTDDTFIGWVKEPVRHYIPDSILVLTEDQLLTRVLAQHSVMPFSDPFSGELTEAQVEQQVQAVIDHWKSI